MRANSSSRLRVMAGLCLLLSLAGCYAIRPSAGAGQKVETARGPLAGDESNLVLPSGYRAELVAERLNFPVGVTFDDQGQVYVVESGYSYGEVFTEARLLRIVPGSAPVPIASGGKGGPWTGVTFADGAFYVADGNVMEGGKILRITPAGAIEPIVTGLPSYGDHHTNGPVAGPDGYIYFSQGTATNSGVVGEDNQKFGWLPRRPDFHDIPARDIKLAGVNFETDDVLSPGRKAVTGAFLPYGTASQPGQVIRGQVKSAGSILRVRRGGGEPELVAWGFRNPFGLAFGPDGALYTTENSYDERGSRKVWGTPDVLWRVEPGKWYGWPDYAAGMPLTDRRFSAPGAPPLQFLLAEHPNPIPPPVALFAVHASADGFDFSRSSRFGYEGQAFVAIFGDQAPDVGKVMGPVGGKVERVDIRTGVITDFVVNRAPHEGPASRQGVVGLERPVAARFDPSGDTLYIVDFGVMLMSEKGPDPKQHTGALWRIRRVP